MQEKVEEQELSCIMKDWYLSVCFGMFMGLNTCLQVLV